MDPKGAIQGPFSSKEVLKWADAGFFTPDQQVQLHHSSCIACTAPIALSNHRCSDYLKV